MCFFLFFSHNEAWSYSSRRISHNSWQQHHFSADVSTTPRAVVDSNNRVTQTRQVLRGRIIGHSNLRISIPCTFDIKGSLLSPTIVSTESKWWFLELHLFQVHRTRAHVLICCTRSRRGGCSRADTLCRHSLPLLGQCSLTCIFLADFTT